MISLASSATLSRHLRNYMHKNKRPSLASDDSFIHDKVIEEVIQSEDAKRYKEHMQKDKM